MTRTIPTDRLDELIRVATRAFVERGFQRTQMADIAEALGVAKGTLYGYVESKESLFDAVVRFADDGPPELGAVTLPFPTPEPGATARFIEARLENESRGMVLPQLICDEISWEDAREELGALLGDLLDRLTRNKFTIKLVDRCATDFPELGEVWFKKGRWAHHQLLVDLMRTRAAQGIYRSFEAPEIVARTLIESVAFWGLHRHFDPSPQMVDTEQVKRTLVELFCRSLLEGQA